MLKADIIVDLQSGDTGKGKVAHALAKKPNYYTHVVRYNGGGNAGHTVYHNGKKFVTHYIPVGVLYGIKSIIGPGCVVDPDKLDIEIAELENAGFVVRGNLFIDKRVHIITPENILEDSKDTKIGTTKTGNGPTYRNKYDRKGLRAEDFYIDDCLIDIYCEFHQHQPNAQILFEGAQGFELDIDWGDYPYVTSSHCTVGSAIMNGVPPQSINRVYGIAKAYRTYVGAKDFEGKDPIFNKIREVGEEYGATTGRPRQVNWLNIDDLMKATNNNGVTDLIINKIDILEKVGVFKLIDGYDIREFTNLEDFKDHIRDLVTIYCPTVEHVNFSDTPFDI